MDVAFLLDEDGVALILVKRRLPASRPSPRTLSPTPARSGNHTMV